MVSAIRRILPFDRLVSLLWSGLPRSPRRQRLTHIDDVSDDLLRDIGIENRVSAFDPCGDIWRRRGGLADYLRPGPF
jgi:hypothetical protein